MGRVRWEFSVRETDEGMVMEFQRDKEHSALRGEAFAALEEFRKKARAAGLTPGEILGRAVLRRMGIIRPQSDSEAPGA